MAYTKKYPNGWRNKGQGGALTPFNADAGNHIEAGIAAAAATADAAKAELTTRLSEQELSRTIADVVGESTASIFQAKVATGSAIGNDINEWWIEPVAASLDDGGATTFKGTVGAPDESLPPYVGTQATFVAAPIILSEWRAGYPARSVVAGVINADDHNVPAVVALPGRRRIAVWSGHYADNKTTIVLSDRTGSLDSMAAEAGNAQTFIRTGLTAYQQVYLDEGRSTSSLSYYWLFQRVRRGTSPNYIHGWTITEFTVDETVDTGGLTLVSDSASAGHGQRYFIRNPDGLSYLAPARVLDGVIRFLWGPHPSGDGKLTTISVNMATGAITGSGLSGKNIFFTPTDANQGAIQDSDLTWDYPALPAGQRRRFFYRERDGHLRAQWAAGDEDNARYLFAERVPAQAADAFNGLRTTPTPGYARAAHRTQHNYTGTVEFGCFTRVPSSPSAVIDVMRKFASSSTGGWYLRVETDGRVTAAVSRTDIPTTPFAYTFTGAVPGLLGSATPFGLKVVVTANDAGSTRMRLYYSVDGGATWTLHGTSPVTGTALPLRQSTDPITLGQGSSVTTLTFTEAWVAVDGARVVDVKFTGTGAWTPHTGSHTDTAGQAWELVGDALVGTTTPSAVDTYVDHEMGVAGPRIGHGAAANYIAGGCIVTNPDGSTRAVVTAHRDASVGESYLLVWRRAATGQWKSTELYRTRDVLARPYQPRGNRSPVGLFVSVIRDYGQGENEFTTYASDAIAFAPV